MFSHGMSVHMYKTFYGLVDVHNGLRARYGLDWKTRRKMARVTFNVSEYKNVMSMELL